MPNDYRAETRSLLSKVGLFLRSEDGPTAVEYAVMLALIIIGAIGAVLATGDVQKAVFFDIADEVNSATQGN